ncbi:acyl-CoA dehydrogenase family protein [Rhodococcus opacus]|uniref:acyl-CoA dehydrogenase family protein n=1 Tax=Rhodococcus opacus TaxID=37919 RepID=UPI001C464F71|nr:acyl-CoA dehydrogenase family protein [Rhodococcus opacus]MBV6760425.1 acyl-CoA dehydrogenase family protein [Rhodococcus opacus]
MTHSATLQAATSQSVLERVNTMVETLRERARETEVQRGMTPENLKDLTDAGVFRLTLPQDRGGFEADAATINEILAQIGRGDPSTAWIASIMTAMNSWTGFLADEGADEILSTADVRITGLIAPTGKAVEVDGGISVSGTWMWNTGGKHSNWVGLACMQETDKGRMPVAALVPTSEVTLHETWDASGMAGTATNKITCQDVFVPASRVVPIPSLGSGEFGERSYSSNPYYNRPAVQLFLVYAAGPILGIARGAMDVFMEKLPGKGITYTSYASAAEAPITHHQLADAQFSLEIAEMYTNRINELAAASLTRPVTIDDRVRTRAYLGQVAEYSRRCVTTLFQASGASAIQHSAHIQRYFRDAQSLALHALIQPTSSRELYGRHLAGLEPNTTLL